MSDSLRDQLLGLGFKPAPKPEKPVRPPQDHQRRDPAAGTNPRTHQAAKPGAKPADTKPGDSRARRDRPRTGPGVQPQGARPQTPRPPKPGAQPQGRKPPRTQEEMDLAKAYAIRAQREKEERIEAERVKQEEARLRREAKAKLAEFLKDKGLNDPAAEIARHFEYGTRIKRIHVNAEQLKALNAGELGVVQLDGRYLLVTAEVLSQAEALFAASVALKVDPDAPAGDDPYADPQYQVPDDLVW
ncbi:MAG: DUF2058 family protein [Lysobacteraceae bacterium]